MPVPPDNSPAGIDVVVVADARARDAALEAEPVLDYELPPPPPKGTDSLLELNRGCFFLAAAFWCLTLLISVFSTLITGVPTTAAFEPWFIVTLALPACLGIIWWFSPQIRLRAAQRKRTRAERRRK